MSDYFICGDLAQTFCFKTPNSTDPLETELIQNGFGITVESSKDYALSIWRGENWALNHDQ